MYKNLREEIKCFINVAFLISLVMVSTYVSSIINSEFSSKTIDDYQHSMNYEDNVVE